ncbi:MAG: hypothetical protein JWR24_2508 [Actinoallomurus sp.]|nr:hypothetical protein [Actinoallomurus sp.]
MALPLHVPAKVRGGHPDAAVTQNDERGCHLSTRCLEGDDGRSVSRRSRRPGPGATIEGDLIWLGGDRILEWYPDSGLYRLWLYDTTATGTDYLLPDVPRAGDLSLCGPAW